MVFARSFRYSKLLSSLFKDGRAEKTYLAELSGTIDKELYIEADIIREDDTSLSIVENLSIKDSAPHKDKWLKFVYNDSSTISFTVIKPIKIKDNTTICEIDIWTGRHHQIRAVANAIGHNVAGDNKYTDIKKRNANMKLIFKRLVMKDIGLQIESRYGL